MYIHNIIAQDIHFSKGKMSCLRWDIYEFSFLPLMGGSVCLLLGNSGRPWRESETTPFPFSTSEAVPSSLRPLSVSLPSPSLSSPSISATSPSVISTSTLCSSLVSGEVHVLSEGGRWREGGGQGSVERDREGEKTSHPILQLMKHDNL